MAKTKTKSNPHPEVARALRLQAKVDLIVVLDLIKDRIDVRSTIVYEIENDKMILSQSDPPILKSFAGNPVQATFLVKMADGTTRRWGYETTILDVVADYRLRKDDPISQPAIFIGPPGDEFTESNTRLDYRIRINPRDGIVAKIRGAMGRVTVIDLSVGGMMVSFPGVVEVTEGERLWYTLTFPDLSSIGGEAEVRRVSNYGKPVRSTTIGLKFLNLEINAIRSLQKTVNRLMLQAQRAKFEEY
ncbi:MAG: PilZ domain-containing protein [Deltaproteobacteria bacterium]|nr:PilZ domain-containing protein [Deltaproteobacteria bacterium]